MILLRIDCDPVPWKAHGGFGRRSFSRTHEEKIYYQFHWKKQYEANFPLNCPVVTCYTFAFRVPHSLPAAKKAAMLAQKILHTKRPDTSNLVKFAEDTLKEIVIRDDNQVVSLEAKKIYAEESYTSIEITPLLSYLPQEHRGSL